MKIRAISHYLLLLLVFSITVSRVASGNNVEEGHRYWQERDNLISLEKCINIYTDALKTDSKNELLLTRLSIAFYWKGNSLPKGLWSRKKRMQAYKTGKQYAAKLCALNPDSIEGNFWHAVNDVNYINEMLIKTSRSVIDDAVRRNQFVMERDKYYYHGGPLRLAAKIIWGLPSIVRNDEETLKNAEQMLKEAISKTPQFALSYIFLSDIYMQMDKRSLAKKALQQVINIDENTTPQFAPENRRDKKEAQLRLKNDYDS